MPPVSVKPTVADASAPIIQSQKTPHTPHLSLYTPWHQLTSLNKTCLVISFSCCCSSPFTWLRHVHGKTVNSESNTCVHLKDNRILTQTATNHTDDYILIQRSCFSGTVRTNRNNKICKRNGPLR